MIETVFIILSTILFLANACRTLKNIIMNGLNLYDYDARQMDGILARFVGVDAHPENCYSWSPYAYVGGNESKTSDYKIPVGAPYSAPSQKTNVAPETKNNLIRIFLDIFNVIIN